MSLIDEDVQDVLIESSKTNLLTVELDNRTAHHSDKNPLRRKRSPEAKRAIVPNEEDFITNLHKRRSVVKAQMNIFISTKAGYTESTEAEVLKVGDNMEEISGDSEKEVVWIDIQHPSKEFMQDFEDAFDLHPLTTEDILTDSREKIELFDDYLLVIIKELHYEYGSNRLVHSNINILVFPNAVVTIHNEELESISKVFYLLECKKNKPGILEHSDWVLHAVMDAAVDLFRNYVDRMSNEAEALDSLVLVFSSGEQNDLLQRIGSARRLMTMLRSQLWNLRDMLITLTTKQHPFITEDIKVYLRDVLDHIVGMEQKLDASKETLNNLHQTYLARISLEAAEASNRVNAVMKKFSAVATIFIPMTLVTGLWGMNVKVPGEGIDNFNWFIGISVALVVFSVATVASFKRWGWF